MTLLQGRIKLQLASVRKVFNRQFSDQKYQHFYFHPGFNPDNKEKFAESFLVFENFVSEGEERTFMKEIEPHLKRHVYEKDHWDDVSCWIVQNIFLSKKGFLGYSRVQRDGKKNV